LFIKSILWQEDRCLLSKKCKVKNIE
jgi:hypothetical protein